MKKVLMIIFGALLVFSTQAQVMEKGDMAVNFGIGIPSHNSIGSYYRTSIPTITLAADKGFSDKIGIGYISGGVQIAISKSKYDPGSVNRFWGELEEYTTDGDVKKTYFYTTVGPRAAYHFDFVDITGNQAFDKFDIYAGVFAGLTFRSFKYKIDGTKIESDLKTTFDHNIFIGGRYNFAGAFGVYLEAGYGVSYLNGGLTWRF